MEATDKTLYWRVLHKDQRLDFYLAKVRHIIACSFALYRRDNMLKEISSAVVLTVESIQGHTHDCS